MNKIKYIISSVIFALCFAATPAFAAIDDYSHYWSFDDATGRSVADTGGMNGVIMGSSTGLGWAGGKSGTSLGMDGLLGESVALPDNFLSGSEGSLSVWFRIEELSDRNVIFSGKSTTDSNIYVMLSVDPEGRPQVTWRTVSAGVDHKVQGVTILNRNEWYNLVLTASSNTYKIYVNGQNIELAGENIGRWFPDLTNQVLSYRIGASEANPLIGSWNGMLDELKLYNRVLSQEDVDALYIVGNSGTPTVPMAKRPTLSFKTSLETVSLGGAVTLTWDSLQTNLCTASGGWSGIVPVSGTRVIENIQQDSVYMLICSGEGGKIEGEIRVLLQTKTTEGAAIEGNPISTTNVVEVPLTSNTTGVVASSFARNLRLGDSGADVMKLQEFLRNLGFLKIENLTTYFGTMTKAALIQFQLKNSVPGTGFFGPMTRNQMHLSRVPQTTSPQAQNSGSTNSMSQEEMNMKIVELLNLVSELQKQLAALRGGN